MNGGKQHYQSAHARFGVATLLLLAATVLGGAASFRRLGLLTRLPERMQPTLKAMHRIVGRRCISLIYYRRVNSEMDLFLQLGLVVWLLGLVTVELALGHHAVWKVCISTNDAAIMCQAAAM